MPKAYSEDLRIRVVEAYQSGESAQDVSKRFEVSIPCVYRWTQILQETGALKPLYKAGDRSKITDDEKFLDFAKAHAHSTLSQMAAAWEGEISIFYLIGYIERDEAKREAFLKELETIPEEKRVWVDEPKVSAS